MRILLIVVVVASGLWGGWWFFAARAAEDAARAWFAAMPGQGLAGSNDGISVQGFPNRIDLTIAAPRIADPQRSLAWQAPFAQIFALSYRPWHLIAALPDSQSFATPAGSASLISSSTRASLVLRPELSAPLDRLTVVIDDPVLSPTAGGTLRATRLRGALHAIAPKDDGPAAGLPTSAPYHIGLSAEGVRADDDVLRWLGQRPDHLPLQIETLRLDATLGLDRPIEAAASGPAPQIRTIDLSAAELVWGRLVLRLSGQLTADTTGRAEGTLQLTVQDWPAALDLARASSLIRADDARKLQALLTGLAPPERDGGRVTLPLRLAGGTVRLGPLVLGPAPRL